MEYFLVRYDSRVVIYDRRGFIRLATERALETGILYDTGCLILALVKSK